MFRRLSLGAYALIAATVLVFGLIVALNVRAARAPIGGSYARGERVPAIDSYDYSTSANTLLIAFSDDCPICRDSTPFYKSLVSEKHRSVRVVFVTARPKEGVQAFLKGAGVADSPVHAYSPERLRIPAVPMLLLVNQQGVLQKGWVGRLAETQEREVVDMLRSLDR